MPSSLNEFESGCSLKPHVNDTLREHSLVFPTEKVAQAPGATEHGYEGGDATGVQEAGQKNMRRLQPSESLLPETKSYFLRI